uniref:Uncharacterized protein n=1 Tax=Ciona savignyi TaxID=51511 RepID=H2YN51_CIOSA
MAFGKSMGNKALSPEKPEQRSPGNTKQLSLSPKSPKQFDCPGYFDGAVYDLPLKDNEGNKTPISSEKTSPKTPEMVHLLDDEHRQMMAELQKSPDEFFQFQSNVMPTSGSEEANMMVSSPDRFCGSPETSSAGYPEIKSPHAFSFPPSTDGPSGSDASFSFNFQPPQSQKSPQNFSFDFQPSSSQSPPQSEGFGFNSSTSAGSDGFSFNFPGAESASKSPEFSFGFGGNTSTSEQKSPPPFFNFDDSDNTGESDTSFSAIFGCGK